MVAERAAHHELTLALEAAANVFIYVDVAGARQLRTLAEERGTVGGVHTVGRALDEERQRCGDVGRLEDDGVQFDTVAHGNHDFRALVVVEDVMDGIAGAAVCGLRLVGIGEAGCVPRAIERETDRELRVGPAKFGGGDGLQLCRDVALRFGEQLSILRVEAHRGVWFGSVGVFAGEGFKLSGSGRGDGCGLRRRPGDAGRIRKQGKAQNGKSHTAVNQRVDLLKVLMHMALVRAAGELFDGHDAAFQLFTTDMFELDGGVADVELIV